jgi:hypothetical protein
MRRRNILCCQYKYRFATIPPLPMPQVDLGPLIAPKSKAPFRPELPDDSGITEKQSAERNGARPRVRLTGAQWTNVAFVCCACLGGLFSALYLIKGGELMRNVAAWPRELFNGRAVSVNQAAVAQTQVQAQSTKDDSGDPFSPASKLLSSTPQLFPRPNNPETASFSSASSIINHLNAPAPGGDALARALGPTELDSASPAPAVSNDIPNAVAPTSSSIAQNEQIKVANTGMKSSPARNGNTARRLGSRAARQSTAMRTTRQAFRNIKNAFFRALFGFKMPRHSTAHSRTARARANAATVRTASFFRSTNRRSAPNEKMTAGKSSVSPMAGWRIQTSSKNGSNTTGPMRSTAKPIQPQISNGTPSALRSTPTGMGQNAQSAAALRAINMSHEFGGIGRAGGR